MKAKDINRIMYASALILLGALAAYLFKWNDGVLNALLIMATLLAGYPTFVKAWSASFMRVFSIATLRVGSPRMFS